MYDKVSSILGMDIATQWGFGIYIYIYIQVQTKQVAIYERLKIEIKQLKRQIKGSILISINRTAILMNRASLIYDSISGSKLVQVDFLTFLFYNTCLDSRLINRVIKLLDGLKCKFQSIEVWEYSFECAQNLSYNSFEVL